MDSVQDKKNQSMVNSFNSKIKIGDKIKVELDDMSVVEYTVKAPASILGGHTPVIWVEERSDCYRLDRVRTNFY